MRETRSGDLQPVGADDHAAGGGVIPSRPAIGARMMHDCFARRGSPVVALADRARGKGDTGDNFDFDVRLGLASGTKDGTALQFRNGHNVTPFKGQWPDSLNERLTRSIIAGTVPQFNEISYLGLQNLTVVPEYQHAS